MARVSDFFFQKKPSLKKKLRGEGNGGLASVSEYVKNTNQKKKFFVGGWGWGGGGG